MTERTVVESGLVVIRGQDANFDYVLQNDGEVYNLTGKTVRVTVMRLAQYNIYPVHEDLIDILITVVTPLAGSTRFSLTDVLSALLPGGPRLETESYVIEYHVPEDDWISEDLLKFEVASRLSP